MLGRLMYRNTISQPRSGALPRPLRGSRYQLILLRVRYFPFVLVPGDEGEIISKELGPDTVP